MVMQNKFLVALHDMTNITTMFDQNNSTYVITHWLRLRGGQSIMLSQFELPVETAYILQETLLSNSPSLSDSIRERIEQSIIEKAAEHVAEFSLDR